DIDEFVCAYVADRSEPGFEGALGVDPGIVSLLGREAEHVLVEAFVVIVLQLRCQMDVRVYEAWQDGCVAEVDYLGTRRDGPVADRDDLVAAHNDGCAIA